MHLAWRCTSRAPDNRAVSPTGELADAQHTLRVTVAGSSAGEIDLGMDNHGRRMSISTLTVGELMARMALERERRPIPARWCGGVEMDGAGPCAPRPRTSRRAAWQRLHRSPGVCAGGRRASATAVRRSRTRPPRGTPRWASRSFARAWWSLASRSRARGATTARACTYFYVTPPHLALTLHCVHIDAPRVDVIC